MKRGKRALAGILILGIIVSLGFVIGADEEGELADTFDVGLSVSGGTAPEIIYIGKMSNIAGTEDHDLANDCSTITKYFKVYVYSDDLTGLPGANPPNTKISVTLKNGAVVRTNHGSVSCVYNGERTGASGHNVNTDDILNNDDFDSRIPSVGAGNLIPFREYTCPIVMQYYDISGSSPGNWQAYAYAQDTTGTGSDGYYNGIPGGEVLGVYALPLPDRDTWVNPFSDYVLVNTPVDYGTVSANSNNLNELPNPLLIFRNCGNQNIPNVKLTAQNLPEAGGGADFPVQNRFFYDPSAIDGSSCSQSAQTFADNVVTTLNPVLVTNARAESGSPSGQSDLKICLDVTGAAGEYSTTNAGGVPWELLSL